MQANSVEGKNYTPVRRNSVVGSIVNNAIVGAGFGALITCIFKPDADSFIRQAPELLEKAKDTEELKKAITNGTHSLEDLIKLKKKDLADKLANEPEVLKGFKSVLSKFKMKNVLKQAGLGALFCGALGLIFGLINKSAEKKAIQRANAQG